MSLHVGEAIGDYRIIGIIGAGGMGQVFQVEHKITKRKEAMKVLSADLAEETQIERFKREIEVQARLNHPNIAAVHNAFRLKDRLVLVLEFVEGQTLENILKQGRIPWQTGLDYVRQTLEALDYAHHNGVIHRDVSPSNLMVTADGQVKLMDFGVAKSLGDLRLTDAGSMIGSLYYMAPEQVKGSSDPDPRSDIYSAGAILYEVTTGKKAFDYEDRFSLMVAQVEEQPKAPSEVAAELPPALDPIILKALSKEASRRYPSARDFLTALDSVIQPAPVRPQRPIVEAKHHAYGKVAAVVVMVAICGLAGFGAATWNQLEAPALPGVKVAVPSAPDALAGIPPAPPVDMPAAPPVHTLAVASDAIGKAAVADTKAEPSTKEDKAAKTQIDVVRPVAKRTSPPRQSLEQAEPGSVEFPQEAKQEEPDVQAPEHKKGHFWGKLNPFRSKSLKKTKDDSALRSTKDAAAEREQ